MSELGSTYDDILEDMECPICTKVGMEPDGSYEFVCPNCGYQGSL